MSWNPQFLTRDLPPINPVEGLVSSNPTYQRYSYETKLDASGYKPTTNGHFANWVRKLFHKEAK